MIIGDSIELLKLDKFKAGDKLWACEFKMKLGKEKLRFGSKPIRGILSTSRQEDVHNKNMSDPYRDKYINYFIPFKKDGSLDWKKAVELSSRQYATTEEDCIKLYNSFVNKHIKWLEEQLIKTKEQLIK